MLIPLRLTLLAGHAGEVVAVGGERAVQIGAVSSLFSNSFQRVSCRTRVTQNVYENIEKLSGITCRDFRSAYLG